MIEFIPFVEEHIPLMLTWLSDGEALRWCGHNKPNSEAQLRQKYLIDKPKGGTHSFIIQNKGEPVGYIQYYRVIDYPEWSSLVAGEPGDYGLDLFIGRDDLIGQGIGTRVLQVALSELIFSHDDATRCILGPSPENKRAIRCYKKCGFRHIRTVISDNGEREYLMVRERKKRALY